MGPPGIYALADPRDAEHSQQPHYVGKGIDWESRAKRHSQPCRLKEHNEDMQVWLRALSTRELKPVHFLLEEVRPETYWEEYPERAAKPLHSKPLSDAEMRWIARGRELGWPLLNATAGGEGCPNPRPSTRAKMSEASRRRQADPTRCGTRRGYQVHLYNNTEPCDDCYEGMRRYYRERNGYKARVPSPCGTLGGYQTHKRRNERPCDACKEARRAQDAKERRARGAKVREFAKCGSRSGYDKHKRLNEEPCTSCRTAYRDYERKRSISRNRARGMKPRT